MPYRAAGERASRASRATLTPREGGVEGTQTARKVRSAHRGTRGRETGRGRDGVGLRGMTVRLVKVGLALCLRGGGHARRMGVMSAMGATNVMSATNPMSANAMDAMNEISARMQFPGNLHGRSGASRHHSTRTATTADEASTPGRRSGPR